MEYRLATEADLDLLAAWNHELMEDEGHRSPLPIPLLRERMRGWLAEEYRAIIFVREAAPVAYALYRESSTEIHLEHFFVRRDARRVGCGSGAMALLRERIWPAGKRLTLEVLHTNGDGLQFWRACGYQEYSLIMEILPGR
jgi:GNAT superfamily N-acetyltransferase